MTKWNTESSGLQAILSTDFIINNDTKLELFIQPKKKKTTKMALF